MKNTERYCLIILLLVFLTLSGCTMRQTDSAQPGGSASAAPTADVEASPSPTPVPTPVPFDLIAEQSGPNYLIPSEISQAADITQAVAQRSGYDLWYAYPGWTPETINGAAGLTGTRMGDPAPVGDIMAAEGDRLYILDEKDLVIVRLDAGGASVLSRVKVGTDWSAWEDTSGQNVNGSERIPTAVFCQGDRLVILFDYYVYSSGGGDLGYTEYTALDIYNVADPSAPEKIATLGQDGAPVSAGIRAGAFYLVTRWEEQDTDEPDDDIPGLYNDGQWATVSADRMLLLPDSLNDHWTIMSIYDLNDGIRSDDAAIYGTGDDVYIGEGEMLFYSPRIASGYSRGYDTTDRGTAQEYAALVCTDIYRYVFNTASLQFAGITTVNGLIGDAGCFDRYNGVLRCAYMVDQRRKNDFSDGSGSVERTTRCDICLLDENMQPLGVISDLADASEDCWIGYLGSKAVVTQDGTSSCMTDLSDPNDLTEIRQLSAPVMAQAIRSMGESGYTAFYRSLDSKLTLSLYDTQMEPLSERTFGSDHSSTLENQMGYFTEGNGEIIAFSADDSYCVYGYSDEKGFYLRGDVFLNDWAWNARGFYKDGILYVADTGEVFLYDLTDFSCLNHIRF